MAKQEVDPRGALGLGDLFVITTAVLWAASFTVIKSAYDEFTPLAFAAVRFVIASLGLLLFMLAWRQPVRVARADLLRTAAVGVFHVGLYQLFFGVGLKYTTASNSILIINTAPVFTVLLVWLTRAEPLTWRQVVGMLLAVTGVVLLVGAGEMGDLSSGHLKGDVLTLLAAWAYAVTPVIVLPLYRRYGTLTVMTVSMLFGTAVLLVAGLPELTRQRWTVSPAAWGQLAYAALGAGSLGYVLWYEGIRRIGPTRVAAYSYLIPPIGVLVAIRVLGEPFGLQHAVGAIVTIAGVALARSRPPQRDAVSRELPGRPDRPTRRRESP
jgi:drug/metabolite transporter (DMT)-like permease